MTGFKDPEAQAVCQRICDMRNKHILRTHPLRWKPLWDCKRGWFPALRPVHDRVTV